MGFKGIDRVSLLTLEGRVVVPFVVGSYGKERLALPKGQSDLVLRKDGKWFLLVTVDVPEAARVPVTDFIGVDLGSKNLATTDDGTNFTGVPVEKCRQRFRQLRKTCQRTGTKSAKRKLQKVHKKESRFRKDKNHCIAKTIVSKAKGTAKAIAVEDLGGIGERIPARGSDARNRMRGWAFAQLRTFITYKATLAGITVVPVDPAYTSQTCPACGHCEKKNRKTRDDFACKPCGYAAPADKVGAMNIRLKAKRYWADVMRPTVGVDDAGGRSPAETTNKPPALAVGS
jgi:IS605 OrfB family transposase